MNPKKLIVIGLILFLIFFILYLFIRLSVKEPYQPVLPTPTPLPVFRRPTLTSVQTEGRINIKGIPVNDFNSFAYSVTSDGNVNIVLNQRYQIGYVARGEYFQISIKQAPFQMVREEAEREFVRILGIDKTEACRLPVNVSTPQFANPEFAGDIYTLSFCSQ